MVEVKPKNQPSAERLEQVEEEIFEFIDDEIRATHDWCKDLVQELTDRYENLSRRHLRIVEQKLQAILQAHADFKRLGRLQDQDQLKQRLLNIIQAQQNRDPILLGTV